MTNMKRTIAAAAVALLFLTLSACEEGVDAVLESDQPFTLYGFFNPRSDTQAVRIFPIEPTLRPIPDDELDAVVKSRDLVTGETIIWGDSLVAFEDSSLGHVAFAPFRVEYGHTYRFEVSRSDGAMSYAEIPVPGLVQTVRLEPFTRRFPNRINAAPYLPVGWVGQARLIQLEVVYEFEVLNVGRNIVSISYDGAQVQTGDGWVVEIDMARDQEYIRTEMLRTGFMQGEDSLIELNYMFMSAMVINGDWNPPGGTFDPEVLVEPGAWTNVENGFGFVGGGYVEQIDMFPTGCFKQLAGFYVPEGDAC